MSAGTAIPAGVDQQQRVRLIFGALLLVLLAYERLAARAGVDLPPPELWLLARLGERAPVTEAQLAEQLHDDEHPIGEAFEQLRQRSLIDTADDGTITLTTPAEEDYERLVAARCAGLRELLAGWHPDQHAELEQLVDRLGRDLVSEIPTPVRRRAGRSADPPRPEVVKRHEQ